MVQDQAGGKDRREQQPAEPPRPHIDPVHANPLSPGQANQQTPMGRISVGPYGERRLTLRPRKGESVADQMGDMIEQMRGLGVDPWRVLQQNVMLSPQGFDEASSVAAGKLRDFHQYSTSPTSYLTQPALDGRAAMELTVFDPQEGFSPVEVEKRSVVTERYGEVHYTVAEGLDEDGRPWKVLNSAGLHDPKAKGIRAQVRAAYGMAREIFRVEGMSWRDVDYVEHVVENIDGPNYKELNRTREVEYREDGRTSKFPSATGIGEEPVEVDSPDGMRTEDRGRFVMSLKASQGESFVKVPLDNIVCQPPSHKYEAEFQFGETVRGRTGDVVGTPLQASGVGAKVPRPWFERGGAVFWRQVPPTPEGPVEYPLETYYATPETALEAQTIATYNSIAGLIGAENLRLHGIGASASLARLQQNIFYVKPGEEAERAAAISDALVSGVPNVNVSADVCYAELLTEARAVAQLPNGILYISGTASIGRSPHKKSPILHSPKEFTPGDRVDVTQLVRMFGVEELGKRGIQAMETKD
ncbi:MAG: hypothetical protein GF416_08305 [Candidatus Altiarchaeales archaeon]|nr:hypothetical protein [Candidatus Altiarchaeales archaeon]MBD3417117.1 hypothetical protein [Candidatus Altiarchaeales archaeon]